jgi:hypothetical protein
VTHRIDVSCPVEGCRCALEVQQVERWAGWDYPGRPPEQETARLQIEMLCPVHSELVTVNIRTANRPLALPAGLTLDDMPGWSVPDWRQRP